LFQLVDDPDPGSVAFLPSTLLVILRGQATACAAAVNPDVWRRPR